MYQYVTGAKLTVQQVRKMRADYEASDDKPSFASLAREYGIHAKAISKLINYVTWRDV